MKVLVAVVAEHAWVENNCLSLCRAFDSITADKFPYVLPRMSVALRLLIRRSEAGMHKLNVLLADSDGKKILSGDLNINFQPPQGSVTEASFSFVLNGQNVAFPKGGDYVVDIIIDGRAEASIPIYIRENRPSENIPDCLK